MPYSPTRRRRRRFYRRHARLIRLGLPVAAALGVAIALIVALSPGGTPAAPAAEGAGADAAASSAPGAFSARTIAGPEVKVPGSRPSVLFFFSIGCGSCGPGAQSLAEAQRQIGDKANFVAVDVVPQETEADIQGFLNAYGADGLAYTSDPDAQLITNYQVTQLSTAIVLDASGTEISRAIDPSAAQIQQELAKATKG